MRAIYLCTLRQRPRLQCCMQRPCMLLTSESAAQRSAAVHRRHAGASERCPRGFQEQQSPWLQVAWTAGIGCVVDFVAVCEMAVCLAPTAGMQRLDSLGVGTPRLLVAACSPVLDMFAVHAVLKISTEATAPLAILRPMA